MTIPSFAKKWRLQYSHWRKENQLESTAYKQNWSKQVERRYHCSRDNLQQDLAEEWPTPWTQSLVITLPKKGNLQQCHNYRTISFISYPSKVMLKIMLNRLKPQAEIIAEEQAGFEVGSSTTKQIYNLRILCEKYLQHQQDIYHVLIHFKKALDRVCHAALWATMKKYKISANLIRVIKNFYDKDSSAVFFNNTLGDLFRTTVGVRQGCLLSPTSSTYFWKGSWQTP